MQKLKFWQNLKQSFDKKKHTRQPMRYTLGSVLQSRYVWMIGCLFGRLLDFTQRSSRFPMISQSNRNFPRPDKTKPDKTWPDQTRLDKNQTRKKNILRKAQRSIKYKKKSTKSINSTKSTTKTKSTKSTNKKKIQNLQKVFNSEKVFF